MSTTFTQTTTYTVSDVARVLNCFAADFDMFAQSSGCRTHESVKTVTADIVALAKAGYLREVNLYLKNSAGITIKAAKYEIKSDGSLSNGATPGNSLWPYTPSGSLNVHVTYSDAWWALTDAGRRAFKARLQALWGTLDLDTTFPTLTRTLDRNYVSNGYGLRKYTFN
jgi:HORMA domain-containing protein